MRYLKPAENRTPSEFVYRPACARTYQSASGGRKGPLQGGSAFFKAVLREVCKWGVTRFGRRGFSLDDWPHGNDAITGSDNRLADAYRQSTWVQSAIKKLAGPVTSVGVEFYRPAAGRKRALPTRQRLTGRGLVQLAEDHLVDVPDLRRFLRNPMPGYGYSALVEGTIGWLKLAGEAFWLLPDEVLLPADDNKSNLHVILARPDRMQHIIKDGRLEGWRYWENGGKAGILLPEQVIHEKLFNPYDPWRGLSEYETARIAAETDYVAARFRQNLMANNGDTGPYIIARAGAPTPEQQAQIMEQLRSKRAALARGEFRPVFIAGDIAVENPQIRTVDASYLLSRAEDRREIYVAFGIPPSMVEVKDAYSIGSASDLYQLVTHTCVSAGDHLCDMLQRLASIAFNSDLEVFLNWDEHPVFQEVRRERMASVDALWAKGVPMSDVSHYLDLGLPAYKGWDVGYLPFSMTPAGEANYGRSELQ